jgi:hypothetical protein
MTVSEGAGPISKRYVCQVTEEREVVIEVAKETEDGGRVIETRNRGQVEAV